MKTSRSGFIGGVILVALVVGGVTLLSLRSPTSHSRTSSVVGAGADGGEPAEGAVLDFADRPDCIEVLGHDGTNEPVGCVLKTDLYAAPPDPGPAQREQAVERFPVFRSANDRTVVGAVVSEVGFVPLGVAASDEELQRCNRDLLDAAESERALMGSCRAIMSELGYPPSYLDGRGY